LRLKESGNKTGMGSTVSLGGTARPRKFRRMLRVAKREFAYTIVKHSLSPNSVAI
jgi:hypothetical protein